MPNLGNKSGRHRVRRGEISGDLGRILEEIWGISWRTWRNFGWISGELREYFRKHLESQLNIGAHRGNIGRISGDLGGISGGLLRISGEIREEHRANSGGYRGNREDISGEIEHFGGKSREKLGNAANLL